jgi:putative redox protein
MVVLPLSLDWHGDMSFANSEGCPPIRLDSSKPEVMSPMQALAYAAMGCMAMDVVHILQKGRHDMKGLRVHFDGERADDHPKRYTKIHMRFDVTGDVPDEAVERALTLSRDKYCSVSNTLRPDLDFTTSFTIKR